MVIESQPARAKRRRQRLLFDTVAERYDEARPAYPDDAVDFLLRTARIDERSAVLEAGCGTGQLTRQLAVRGVRLTAIDIGPWMIAAARRSLPEGRTAVTFQVTPFEELPTEDGSFDLVVFADAFHWVDFDVRFAKSSCLLRPGGWLAVLSLEHVYDEPLMTALLQMWMDRSDDGGMWLREPGPTTAQAIDASGHFASALESSFCARLRRSASMVLKLETTRATALSWTEDDRRAFIEELRGQLRSSPVDLTQVVHITMAQAVQ